MSHELSKDFNRRLRAELFLLRHVEVVNEDDSFDPETSGSEVTCSDFLNLAIYNVLNLVAMGLCTKPDFNSNVLLSGQLIQKDVLNVNRLACSSRAHEESRDHVRDAVLLNV